MLGLNICGGSFSFQLLWVVINEDLCMQGAYV